MTLPYGNHHQRMMQQFIAAGYPPHIAAGFVGNAMMESGVSINPAALNKGEGAYGAFQMRGDRRAALEALARQKGSTVADLDVQIAHALQELSSTEASAASRVQSAQTPEEAAALVDKHFERSAGLHTPQRQNYARHVYNQYIGGAGAQTPDGPGPVEALPPSQAPVGGPGAGMNMHGSEQDIRSLIEQMGASGGLMDAASSAAPTSATDLMLAAPEDDAPPGSRIALGIGALGEALAAWSQKRPMDLEFLETIPKARKERKAKVNETHAWIQLLNDEGQRDLAEAIVNGADVKDVQKVYQERISGKQDTAAIQNLEHARKLAEAGDIAGAELLLRGANMLPSDAKPSTAIQEAQWLANPNVPQAEKDAFARSKLTPDRVEYLRSLGAETPEEMIALEQQLRQSSASNTNVNVDLGQDAGTKGAEAYGTLQAKRLEKFHADASLAEQRMADITTMTHLMDTGMQTGSLQTLLMPFKGYLQDLGINFEGLAEQQTYQSIQQGMLPKLMSDIKGAASDFESKALLNAIPSVDKDEMANRILIQSLAAKNKQEMDKALFMEEYMVAHDYSLSGADREWREKKKEYQIFKQFPTRAAAARAIAAGEIAPNEVIIVGDGKNASNAQLYLGRHLGL